MRQRLRHTNILNSHISRLNFNLKFMGVMAGALSIVLYPNITKAENSTVTQEVENLSATTPESSDDFSQTNQIFFVQEEVSQEKVLNQEQFSQVSDEFPDKSPGESPIESENSSAVGIKAFEPANDTKLPRSLQKLVESRQAEAQLTQLTIVQPDKQPKNEPTEITPTASPASLPIASTTKNNQVKILTPLTNSVLDIPATTVVLEVPLGEETELRVNGELVDRSLIGRTETGADTITQSWFGVSLKEGENTITARIVGSTEDAASIKVQVRGAADKLKVETLEVRIPADGRSTATVRGELVDASGNRSNTDAVVTLLSNVGEFVGEDHKPEQPGFQVLAKGGEFRASLKSTLDAQTARIRATSGELEAFTQVQFETALRPSIMTGVVDLRLGARGTDFYSRFRDFLPIDRDNSTEFNFRSAVFATGAIGEWLFTGAVDNTRNLNEDCNCDTRLFRTYQFSEQNYPVYGDSSTVDVLAPSVDSFFVRLERSPKIPGANPDYFMWGDYNTEEFARASQQFTAITRQLHGFKTNYNLGNLQITGLYGNNVQGFQRDTIPPDGTSGFYFLSQRLLQPGSESIFIELEELNRPGTVLERQRLNRGPDYEIDYDRGTLLFREPILRTDVGKTGEVLVRRIVATYQYEGQNTNDNNIYAGRLQYNFSRTLNQERWFGATYIQENQGVRQFELYGADTMISFGNNGKLMAEFARSTNESDILGLVSGYAWRVEAQGKLTNAIQARAYYRFADTGFANNATVSFVPGQTRYGVQVTGQITRSTSLRAQYDHEDNFGIAPQPLDRFEEFFAPRTTVIPGTKVDNSLTTISAGIQQRFGKATFDFDWLHRNREERLTATTTNSDQLRSRLTVPITNKLTFLAQNELTLSNQTDTVFPDRTIFGLNYEVIPGINVNLSQQFYTRGQFDGNSLTALSVNGEHSLGRDTKLTGRYTIYGGANEITSQGAVGINQGFTIARGMRLNLAYERVFGDFLGRSGAGTQFTQPFAVGQSAAALGINSGDSYSVGLEYTDNPDFKASARFEHRSSSTGSNTVISAGTAGKISPSLTALARYQQASASNQGIIGLGDTASLRVGLAYRDPNNDKFNALLRYEYRKNPATLPDSVLRGSGTGASDHTFALEAIYAPSWQWEIYGKYAFRNSTSYLAQDLVGTSSANLGQVRLTYRLGYSVDLVGEARIIGQKDYTETGYVVEAGYYLAPNLRLSAGYAFGKVDDRDFSGTRSAGGFYLGLSVKLDELFDGFGRQKPAPKKPQPQKGETTVETQQLEVQVENTQAVTEAEQPNLKELFKSEGSI